MKEREMEELIGLLTYAPSVVSGLVWAKPSWGRVVGTMAGSNTGKNYFQIRHHGVRYGAHRIVWEMHHGPIPIGMQVDHIDRNRLNNSIENLRLATASQNRINMGKRATNKTGVKGVSMEGDRFLAVVIVNGAGPRKRFRTLDAAEAWVQQKREELHGDFACS